MTEFDQKIFALNSKLNQMSPKFIKCRQMGDLEQSLQTQKEDCERFIREWFHRYNKLELKIIELSQKLHNIKVESQMQTYHDTDVLQEYIEECQEYYRQKLNQTQITLTEVYCKHTQQTSLEIYNSNTELNQLAEQIQSEVLKFKKIMKEATLNLIFDKQYEKKLEKIKENQRKKTEKIQQMKKGLKDRIEKFQHKMMDRLQKQHRDRRAKYEKLKRILELTFDLL